MTIPCCCLRASLKAVLRTILGLALLTLLAVAIIGCESEPVRTVEVSSTNEPAPMVARQPTPDIPATVMAVMTRVAPTPAATPDIPATVTAAVAAAMAAQMVAAAPAAPDSAARPAMAAPPPSPEPSMRSVSDVVRSVDAGLYQVITPDASGSGFLVSDQGHIVTNAHVVGQHRSVTVRSASGETANARVLGKDGALDLAVLMTEPLSSDARPMPLASASSIRPGDEVIALGFPLSNDLGMDYTVTTGVVSSRRVNDSVEQIQTDAAINPGSSGGPLINRNGEVIGVNTSALADYDGIFFAVSVAEVKASLESLIAGEGSIEISARWRTYENPDCQYRLLVHPGWTLNEESEPCRVHVERYADDDLVGTVNVSAHDLNGSESLGEFAGQWRDSLVARAGRWESFEIVSFKQLNVGSPVYLLDYRWWETDADCAASGTAMIVQSNHLPKALVFSAGVCDFAPDAILEEVVAMDLSY